MSEEDTLHDVWQFSADVTAALSSNSTALKNSLGCVICNLLMLEPYTLQCGHSFCSKCLQSWLKQMEKSCTCPQCRKQVTVEPVLNLALRQLALTVVNSWNSQSGERARISQESMALQPTPEFLTYSPACIAQYDSEDEVYRCPHCHYEIEDSQCSNCGRMFTMDSEFENMADAGDYTESNEDSESDDLRSFIDDDDSDQALEEDTTVHTDVNSDESSAVAYDYESENSDDSLLEETYKRNHISLIDSDSSENDENSDVQLVSIRHRPVVINDDDDD